MNRLIPVIAALLAGGLGTLSFFRNIELDTYDRRVAATARPAAPADRISLVFIDNDSLRRMEPLVGRWPWPRLVHATVIDYLAAAGAKVIAYDVLFPERDIRKFMVANTEWTGEESDAALVEATRKAGNVVHVAEAASRRADRSVTRGRRGPHRAGAQCETGDAGVRANPPALDPAVSGAGPGRHERSATRCSSWIRTVRCGASSPVVQVGDRTIPSLSLAAITAAGATGGSRGQRRPGPVRGAGAVARSGGERNGLPTFTSYSFYDLFRAQQQVYEGQKPDIDPSLFRDRIVIVGVNADGLHEVFTTPFPAR